LLPNVIFMRRMITLENVNREYSNFRGQREISGSTTYACALLYIAPKMAKVQYVVYTSGRDTVAVATSGVGEGQPRPEFRYPCSS